MQIAIASGEGGTGKISVVASFAVLAEKVVLADCDVDAADLHLYASSNCRLSCCHDAGPALERPAS